MQCKKKIILASASPRRKELLKQIRLDFEVCPSECEEKTDREDPSDKVKELAMRKALEVFSKVRKEPRKPGEQEILVIGADTIVQMDGEVLGKPATKENAISMLKLLQGKTHQVYTGISFVWEDGNAIRMHSFFECTEVEVLSMTDEEIAYYVGLDTCMDKAGAYGIQNEFACYIAGIHGDYNNVVGLPAGRVYQELKRLSLLKF